MVRGRHTRGQAKVVLLAAQPLQPPGISIDLAAAVAVDPCLSSYQAQVQVVVVVHVAQQVQPPGAITTAVADVQVAPTLPV